MIALDFTDARFDALTGCLTIKPVNLPMLRQWLLREYKALLLDDWDKRQFTPRSEAHT